VLKSLTAGLCQWGESICYREPELTSLLLSHDLWSFSTAAVSKPHWNNSGGEINELIIIGIRSCLCVQSLYYNLCNRCVLIIYHMDLMLGYCWNKICGEHVQHFSLLWSLEWLLASCDLDGC